MTERIALIGLFLIFFWHALFMSKLGEPIYSRKKTVIWSVCMAVLLITGYILMYTVGMSMGAPILSVAAMIVLLVVFFKTCSDPIPKKIFILITYYNFFFLIVQISFLISSMIYEPDSEPYQILSIIVRNVIQFVSFVLYFKYIGPKLQTVNVQRNSEWWYLSVISVLFTVIYITQAMICH
ncbi:MAG: hypothetical protein K2H23_06850 [Oscillospiraceae bacterium]|nr:hypothetical protein [Oscillospiraceae bacterium]